MTQSRFCSPEDSFQLLVETLRGNGYTVDVSTGPIYDFAHVTGKNIDGGFCTPSYGDNDAPYWYIDGKFAADHVDCFDKWSKCPLVVKLPENEEELLAILEHLKFLASEEGYNWSNSYSYLDDPRLPKAHREE
jgi:hypothetical protein